MTIKKVKTQSSKLKTTTQTLKLTFGHPEDEVRRIPCQASEGFFADAQNDSPLFVILRAEPEGSHANSFFVILNEVNDPMPSK